MEVEEICKHMEVVEMEMAEEETYRHMEVEEIYKCMGVV